MRLPIAICGSDIKEGKSKETGKAIGKAGKQRGEVIARDGRHSLWAGELFSGK